MKDLSTMANGLSDDLWTLEHSQHSEDVGMYPFHIDMLKRTLEINLTDCLHNHRKENKWQLVFIGSHEDCSSLVEHLVKQKNLDK